MQNRVRPSGFILFISGDNMKAFCLIEFQRAGIMFIYINPRCSSLFSKINESCSISFTDAIAVNEKHLYRI